jgi:hypothetical protein
MAKRVWGVTRPLRSGSEFPSALSINPTANGKSSLAKAPSLMSFA